MNIDHVNTIMKFISDRHLKSNDGVGLQIILDDASKTGIDYQQVQNALVVASQRGWIMLNSDFDVHLTESGYVALNVANDNLHTSLS